MADYRLRIDNPVPLFLLVPTYETVAGVDKKTYPLPADGIMFFGSFKTYGGTDREVNGVYSIEDTAIVETWYRPDITGNCRVALESGATYDILGEPEDISQRHQFLKFKVRRVKGGV